MFVLIVSESPNLLSHVLESLKGQKQGVQYFGTTLMPPSGPLGMPLADPFEILPSFDFSDKLIFPKNTLVICLNELSQNSNTYRNSFEPNQLGDIYSKAFTDLSGPVGIVPSKYLSEIKERKVEIKKSILQSVEVLSETLKLQDGVFNLAWQKYTTNQEIEFKVFDVVAGEDERIVLLLKSWIEAKKTELTSNKPTRFIVRKLEKRLSENAFTMPYSSMGFGDFYQRLEKLYNFVKTISDFAFIVEPYVNPHSSELDFNTLVSISGDDDSNHYEVAKTYDIGDFFSFVLSSFFADTDVKFNVILGPGRAILNNISELFETNENFVRTLKLDIPQIDFVPFFQKDTVKVVYHMRRHDTALAPFKDILPQTIRKRLGVERPLLDFASCDVVLNSYLRMIGKLNSDVEIVVISDGIEDLKLKFDKVKSFTDKTINEVEVQDKFRELSDDLLTGSSSLPNAVISSRVIGRDTGKTLESIKTIQESDFVITSSGFSIFMARIVGSDFVNGFQALPLIQKGETSFDSIIQRNDY